MRRVHALFVSLVTLVLPALAWGNAAPPFRQGSVGNEPNGLAAVAIVGEELTIDLRPLTTGEPVLIEAVYRLQNKGEPVTTDLVFVSGSPVEANEAGVWLNDRPVPFVRSDEQDVPKAWGVPKTTPVLGDGPPPQYYTRSKDRFLTFTVTLPGGASTLRVRYRTPASAYVRNDSPTRFWQLAYVLAPAREWGGFGELKAQVLLPAGWEAASEPALERHGDELVGTFTGIPADTLALTVRSPVPESPASSRLLPYAAGAAGLVVGLLLAWGLGRVGGRVVARRRASDWRALPYSMLGGVLWAAIALGVVLLVVFAPTISVPEHQRNWNADYGRTIAALFFGVPAVALGFLIGLAVTQSVAARARRNALA